MVCLSACNFNTQGPCFCLLTLLVLNMHANHRDRLNTAAGDHSETMLALQVEEVDALTDPCPLPSTLKKRGLNERERLLYAPMADVGGLLYDKDAVYIDIGR